MQPLRLCLTLACLALPVAAQQHVHPHIPSQHSHDQVQVRTLNFGTVDIPVNMAGTAQLPSGTSTTPTVSPLLKAVAGTGAGCATYYIKDGGVTESHETTWKVLTPTSSTLSFDLVNTTNSSYRVRVTLDPQPSPATGTYQVTGDTFRSENFYWGGRVDIPADAPAGTYRATTPTWTTIGPISGSAVNGFVITEDFCNQGVTYGISSESTTFQVAIVLRRSRQPLTVKSVADMHFGAILPGKVAGTVVLDPALPAKRTGSNVVLASTGATATPGVFTVLGTANATVDYLLPASTTLTGPNSATMTVDTFTAATENAASTVPAENGGSGAFTIKNLSTEAGRLVNFLVGARLKVGASQTPGTYTGTYLLNFAYR